MLLNYQSAVKPQRYYTQPKIVGSVNGVNLNTKTYMYCSPMLKSSVIQLKSNERYLNSANYFDTLFYVVKGTGTVNGEDYSTGDVITANQSVLINSTLNTQLFNVDDSGLYEYLNVQRNPEWPLNTVVFKHNDIMESIENAPVDSNRCGVIFGTNGNNWVGKNLWCLMTKTVPHGTQPPHRHNSVAIDYVVSGEGYTLLSQQCNEGTLVDPIKIYWTAGMIFVTPPGWWHSHHSTSDEDSYLFPVQDAGFHMFADTLDIQFI